MADKKSWQRYKSIDHGLDVVGMDRHDLASRLTEVTGDTWSYQMVAKLCSGRKRFDADIVWAVAQATELPYEWFLDDPRNVRSNLNTDKGASLSSWLDTSGYLIPDWHPANMFVPDEWHTRDEIPGQTEIVIDLEYAEAI